MKIHLLTIALLTCSMQLTLAMAVEALKEETRKADVANAASSLSTIDSQPFVDPTIAKTMPTDFAIENVLAYIRLSENLCAVSYKQGHVLYWDLTRLCTVWKPIAADCTKGAPSIMRLWGRKLSIFYPSGHIEILDLTEIIKTFGSIPPKYTYTYCGGCLASTYTYCGGCLASSY